MPVMLPWNRWSVDQRSITDRRDFVRVDMPAGVRDVRADDLIVEVLKEAVRRGAEKGQDLTGKGAVRLGCPAMWDGRQRRRLLEVAQRAGLPLTLSSLVDEPVAAGIAWLATRDVDAAGPLRVVVFIWWRHA
jgi:molecular chaperone DnaK (HSP70)